MAQLAGPLEGAQASPCQAASDHGKGLLCTTVHSVHNCALILDGSPIGQWEGFLEYILYISVLSYWPAGRVFIVHSVHNFCSPIGRASYWQVERVARIHSVHNFALLLAGSPIGQQEGVFENILYTSWLSNWLRRNAVQKICSNFPETVFTNFIIL